MLRNLHILCILYAKCHSFTNFPRFIRRGTLKQAVHADRSKKLRYRIHFIACLNNLF